MIFMFPHGNRYSQSDVLHVELWLYLVMFCGWMSHPSVDIHGTNTGPMFFFDNPEFLHVICLSTDSVQTSHLDVHLGPLSQDRFVYRPILLQMGLSVTS